MCRFKPSEDRTDRRDREFDSRALLQHIDVVLVDHHCDGAASVSEPIDAGKRPRILEKIAAAASATSLSRQMNARSSMPATDQNDAKAQGYVGVWFGDDSKFDC